MTLPPSKQDAASEPPRTSPGNDASQMVRRPSAYSIGLLGVFAFAFAVRLLPVLRGGGLHFYGRYDDGVYYTASETLTFGHVPYRDFVLLHPPASMIALMPFTLLGRLTSDPIGMTAARISTMALGSISAVLVAIIVSRWGRGRGIVAGLIYGASAAAAYSEQATFLEPLGTFLVLIALLALTGRSSLRSPRLGVFAGVVLGLACTLKIWYGAIFVVVLLVLVLRREFRAGVQVALAGTVAGLVATLPFFALAPQQMWTMVVEDQFGRNGSSKARLERITSIAGTKTIFDGASPELIHLVTLLIVIVVAAAVILCLADPRTWLIVATFLACALVLFASPSYFRHYGVLLAAPSALVLGIGIGGAIESLRRRTSRLAVGGLLAAIIVASGIAVSLVPTGSAFPSARFAAAAPTGCIGADDPAALIQMDRLTSDLRDACDVPVDVTGVSYGAQVPRGQNTAFRSWLVNHLIRSDGFVVMRQRRDKFSEGERNHLRSYPVLASANGLNLRQGDGG